MCGNKSKTVPSPSLPKPLVLGFDVDGSATESDEALPLVREESTLIASFARLTSSSERPAISTG